MFYSNDYDREIYKNCSLTNLWFSLTDYWKIEQKKSDCIK